MGLCIFLKWTLFMICIGEGDGILWHVNDTSVFRKCACLSKFLEERTKQNKKTGDSGRIYTYVAAWGLYRDFPVFTFSVPILVEFRL